MSQSVTKGYTRFACDVCGSSKAVELPHVRRYTNGQLIHICKECGFIYVKDRRPFDKIARVWAKQLYGRKYTAKTPLMLARHTYIAEFMDQYLKLKNKRVIDIGAGEGQFLHIVKNNYGASVFGIEPSSVNCRMMKRLKIPSFDGALEDYIAHPSCKKGWADVATLLWTLEGATSPREILLGARRIIKDGGYILIGTGSRILVPCAKPLNYYLSTNPVDSHPSRFSFATLRLLLAKTGFDCVHHNPYLNDSMTMCVIAKKRALKKNVRLKGDDYRRVRDFFNKWHNDTQRYLDQ